MNFNKAKFFKISFLVPFFIVGQEICEPIYTVPTLVHVNSVGANGSSSGGEMQDANNATFNTLHLSVGQPFIGGTSEISVSNSVGLGFFSYNIREPIPPTMRASDGDFQESVLVEWDIIDSYTGPPITSNEVVLYRNGYALTTVPLEQTEYMDFNVFAGSNYEYEAVVTNERGSSYNGGDFGFLSPNGIVTGQVSTTSGNPVENTVITLTPNLGLSAKFNGDGYIFWYDNEIDANRQFSGFEEDYSIEMWFRSVTLENMTLFAAVDSASSTHFIDIKQNSNGYIEWTHSPLGKSSTTLTSADPYAGPGEIFHHLALVYDHSESSMKMFIDGYIVATGVNADKIDDTVEIILGKKGPLEHLDYYHGYIDDFRVWRKARSWEDIRIYDGLTLSGEEDSLAGYWKFDENVGLKIFDLSVGENGLDNNNDGEMCLVEHSDLIGDVFVGALTDSLGNYIIKNINYGNGTTFTVTPSLESIIGRSLEFDGVNDYIDFSARRIELSNGFTIESWFKTPGASSDMILFSTRNPVDQTVQLEVSMLASSSQLTVKYFDQVTTVGEGLNNNLWHHWAVAVDTLNQTIEIYIDGGSSLGGSQSVELLSSNLIDDITVLSELKIGSGLNNNAYFLGFIDESRVWNGPRTLDQITGTMNQTLVGDETGLSSYWNFNSGTGILINDVAGSGATGMIADTANAENAWSIDIPLEETYSHYYLPESRFTTLNYSNTSVDLVNFIDNSLIPVTGYVQYYETSCFIEFAEVLIDGASLIPPVYTDSDGKFTLDLEPGSIGQIVTVDYLGGEMEPAFIELPLMTRPISGQYFGDKTVRNLSGSVGGGECMVPLPLNEGEQIEVTLTAVDGCFEETVIVDDIGNYSFAELPPIIYNLSVYHPDPDIVFDADTVSLETQDREKFFSYYAPLNIAFSPGSTVQWWSQDCYNDPGCQRIDDGLANIDLQRLVAAFPEYSGADAIVTSPFEYSVGFDVFEVYGENTCAVGTYDATIIDDITPSSYVSNLSASGWDGSRRTTIFTANTANMLSGGDNPHQVSIQITVEDDKGRTASDTYWAIVLANEAIDGSGFTVTGGKRPFFVLRVPPGDESYSFVEPGETVCEETSYEARSELGIANTFETEVGFKKTVSYGTGFVNTETTIEFNNEIENTVAYSVSAATSETTTNCIEITETFTAYGDGLVTGDDATVFIGGSETFAYSFALNLELVPSEGSSVNNALEIDTVFAITGSTVSSTYMHSKYYIKNTLIPNYDILMAGVEENSTEFNQYQEDQQFFIQLLEDDSIAVLNASSKSSVFRNFGDTIDDNDLNNQTITFDAGVDYSYISTSSSSVSRTTEISASYSFETENDWSLEIDGSGFGYVTTISRSVGFTNTETGETTYNIGNGFYLGDDDAGDNFSFSVYDDPDFNMPVFVVNGGESSCPWEEGTLKRQAASITSAEPILLNQPPEEPAVFTVTLGNLSETGDPENYFLNIEPETNLNGLLITAAGENLANGVTVTVPAAEQVDMDISISRGPELYEYAPVIINFMPPCEDEIAAAKGGDAAVQNMDNVALTVSFKEPCSESTVSFPEDGWVVDANHIDGDTLKVTVSDYDLNSENIENLKLQFRKDGLGDWFTAAEVDIDSLNSLNDNYVVFNWNISPNIVTDGFYELRSVVTCSGDNFDGISSINSGIIDRTGPRDLIVTPASGVLGASDIISLTFDETIDCSSISLGEQDVTLTNTVTGDNIDFNLTCGDDIIVVEPNIADRFLENLTLRADVSGITDPYGNEMEGTYSWEFFFNKNPVGWVGADITDIILYVDEEYSTSRILENVGGSNNSYYMFGGRDISIDASIYPDNTIDLPSWITVNPTSGTLIADSEQEISIGLVEGLGYGEYNTTIYAGVNGIGDEPLNVNIRKLCYEPDWQINPSDFQFSMNMTARLFTQPSLAFTDTSRDVYDMVGVFVGDDLRGVANITYLPELETISNFHPYEVFLTIYSNVESGEQLSFKVWDASNCALMGRINESYLFEDLAVLGSLTNPVPLTATNEIVKEVNFSSGWTWISFNTIGSDTLTSAILGTLNPSDNDIIKGQIGYSLFSAGNWYDSNDFPGISHQKMYKIKLSNNDDLTTVGFAVDVELDTIDINEGWNWIGYTPQEAYPVNEALESLSDVLTGDLIKNQTSFAQYLENYGWFGSLTYMSPGEGYVLKSSNEGELLYPFNIASSSLIGDDENLNETSNIASNRSAPEWAFSPNAYPNSMSIVAELVTFDSSSFNANDLVGAFVDGECRGIASPQFISAINKHLAFLTVYGDETESSEITFQVYHEETDEILYVANQLEYNSDNIVGTISEPYIVDARLLAVGDEGFIPEVFSLAQNYPNPFNPVTTIGYGIASESNVRIDIYSLLGEKVATLVDQSRDPGYYFVNWDSRNDLGAPVAAGMYIYQIRTENFVKSRKLILLK